MQKRDRTNTPETERADASEPVRTCVICRERFPKRELSRFVATRLPAPGLTEDPTQTMPGRGWYVCGKKTCRDRMNKFQGWRKKLKGE